MESSRIGGDRRSRVVRREETLWQRRTKTSLREGDAEDGLERTEWKCADCHWGVGKGIGVFGFFLGGGNW